MSYAFLRKAQSQPDLSDFCNYVKKPLSVLEDILHRYEELQLNKKVISTNLEIYHKCDSILQKHLPEMVDNFCNFSFEYRNNEKIKINDNTALTPKELLLKNLAKIVEEVKVIEKEFNHNNAFNVLAQTKVLSNYGFQPELSLETGQITKDEITLDNKFDYEKFVESNEFKKPVIAKQEELNVKPIIPIKNDSKEATQNGGLFSVILVIMSIVLISILALFTFSISIKKSDKIFAEKMEYISNKIAHAYDKEKFNELSNEILIKSEILTEENLKTPWGSVIKINEDVYGLKTEGKYSLTFNMVSPHSKDKYDGDACENIAYIANKYSIVSFAQYVVKSENDITKNDFVDYCERKHISGIRFPTDSVTLVSK